jgi:hypothetical protein
MAEKEKDMFWIWIGGLIVAVILGVVMVKGSEHDKYSKAESLIAEDASNSAYKGSNNNN